MPTATTAAPSQPEIGKRMDLDIELVDTLQRYWGYDTFRPGQEAVVRSIAAGRDACVVMPTGGGKSLCYQLPAVLDAARTLVVVSPLIALMQDQVAQLEQMGIPAAFVNSSLAGPERSQILKRAMAGEFRLLYFSPERVALGDTAELLKRIASRNGGTNFGQSTGNSAGCANCFRISRSRHLPPARRSGCATTSSNNCGYASRTSISPASGGQT